MVLNTRREVWAQQGILLLLVFLVLFMPIPKAGMLPIGLVVYFLVAAILGGVLLFQTVSLGRVNVLKTQLVWLLPPFCLIVLLIIQYFFFYKWVQNSFMTQYGLPIVFVKSEYLRGSAYFFAFWFCCWGVASLREKNVRLLIGCVFLASIAQAIFGLWHVLTEQSEVLSLWVKQSSLKNVTGTFVNRNHFAGYFAICLPLVVAFCFDATVRRDKKSSLILMLLGIFYGVVCFLAIISSHSRMGGGVIVIAMLFLAIVFSRNLADLNADNTRKKYFEYFPWVLVFFVTLFAVWFGLDELIARFQKLDNGDSRFDAWLSLLNLPREAWVYGIGLSNFADAFLLHQPEVLTTRFKYAHNDYLQLLLELGGVCAMILSFAVVFWVYKLRPKGPLGVRVGALAAIIAIALHSMVDFNLHIPANAFYFSIALGVFMNANLVEGVATNNRKGKSLNNRHKKRQRYHAEPVLSNIPSKPKLSAIPD